MIRWSSLGATLVALCIVTTLGAPTLLLGADAKEAAKKATKASGAVHAPLDYLVLTTGDATGAATENIALPLVVALHGMGDRPETFARLFQGLKVRARVLLPRAPRPHGDGGSWYLTVREDREPEARAESIEDAADRLATLIAKVKLLYPTTGRAVVTGFSQGGVLAFVLAIRHPELFKLAVPLAGELPWRLRPLPPQVGTSAPRIRAMHGTADRNFSLDGTQRGIEHLVGLDYDATVTPYPGVKHKLSPAMRTDLYRLLSEALGR